jgi:hypothetical protein
MYVYLNIHYNSYSHFILNYEYIILFYIFVINFNIYNMKKIFLLGLLSLSLSCSTDEVSQTEQSAQEFSQTSSDKSSHRDSKPTDEELEAGRAFSEQLKDGDELEAVVDEVIAFVKIKVLCSKYYWRLNIIRGYGVSSSGQVYSYQVEWKTVNNKVVREVTAQKVSSYDCDSL